MTHIPAELRRAVFERAGHCCEYCLLGRSDSLVPFHVDHVIAEKHGGKTIVENLCLSCANCNSWKGTDIASIDPETDLLAALFNPRKQQWIDHFRLDGAVIKPLTAEGRVTVFLLRLNVSTRILEREVLIPLDRYPCQPSQ